MPGELVVGRELHGEECLAPLLEPLVLSGNVQANVVVQRHRSGFLALGGGHRVGEHLAGQHRLRWPPADVANIDADALDGIGRSGRVVEVS